MIARIILAALLPLAIAAAFFAALVSALSSATSLQEIFHPVSQEQIAE